jgi:hypothetical protein
MIERIALLISAIIALGISDTPHTHVHTRTKGTATSSRQDSEQKLRRFQRAGKYQNVVSITSTPQTGKAVAALLAALHARGRGGLGRLACVKVQRAHDVRIV